jgi:UDP-N-acetyl-D-mannosaminuronate dehydrogenase
MSLRPAWATHQDPISKNNKKVDLFYLVKAERQIGNYFLNQRTIFSEATSYSHAADSFYEVLWSGLGEQQQRR